jgi:hypothetical protein
MQQVSSFANSILNSITEALFVEQSGIQDSVILVVCALVYKLHHRLSAAAFDQGQYAFTSPSSPPPVPPLNNCHRQLAQLAGFDAVKFNCCYNSCICYAPDEYHNLQSCLYCHEPRFNASGKPRKQFSALPITPILCALVEGKVMARHMTYRSKFMSTKHGTSDMFDGKHYWKLCKSHVKLDGRRLDHTFFSDLHDVALGLATNGFSVWNKGKATAWPLLLVNYNLPPQLRFRQEHVICIGCIPGPKKAKDANLFLWFFIRELLHLAMGVKACNGLQGGHQFILQAYLMLCTGDMPAIAMLMQMLGHNRILGCCMCNIEGVWNPSNPCATTHYPALNRRRHPSKPTPVAYTASALPLRTHKEFMAQAREVQLASSKSKCQSLSRMYRIKGRPALSFLSSMLMCHSFPLGAMHLFL